MNWIIENAPAWNGWMAVLLYWLPLALCSYGYAVRTVRKVQQDRKKRDEAAADKHGFYMPSVTVGTLVGYAALTVCPAANLCAALFDVAPKLFSGFLDWCGRVLDFPLVPKRGQ